MATETTQNNRLICEFMDIKPRGMDGKFYYSDSPWYSTHEDTAEKVMKNIAEYVKYHTEWNWIMPVVEKIGDLAADMEGDAANRVRVYFNSNHTLADSTIFSDLETVYERVVAFIKWYNENK